MAVTVIPASPGVTFVSDSSRICMRCCTLEDGEEGGIINHCANVSSSPRVGPMVAVSSQVDAEAVGGVEQGSPALGVAALGLLRVPRKRCPPSGEVFRSVPPFPLLSRSCG